MADAPIGVLGLGAYVPDRVMTNDEWAQHVDTSDEWITARTGIKTRRVAAENQTTVDLAAAAAERALEDAGVDIAGIDEIIIATDTPEVVIPDTAAYLQNRLGAREVPAFDLAGSGCAGFILGLAENLGMIILPGEYKIMIAYAILFIVILIKPEGLLGSKRG